ncbi:MAG: c-type cytochrome, partial [Pseudobdellovibrionaceae bacterium]
MRWRGPFIILSIINILLFQSCGRYAPLKFAVPESFDLSSTSASTPEALFEKGQRLYATNCAACHAPLTSSTKKNRTAAQIQDAIKMVGVMSSLKTVLSEQDIIAIEKALDSRKPGDLDPHLNFACDANSMKLRGITQSLIKRFTKQEMVNTLQSLLGTTIFSDSVIQTELAKITPDIISKEPTDIPYSASSFYFSSL